MSLQPLDLGFSSTAGTCTGSSCDLPSPQAETPTPPPLDADDDD